MGGNGSDPDNLLDERILEEMRKYLVEQVGKYRKHDVERAIDCFIRKNILCRDYIPPECKGNPLIRELNRKFIDLVRKFRPRDCTYRRFKTTVEMFMKYAVESLSKEGVIECGEARFPDDLAKKVYPLLKHVDPAGVAIYICYLKVGKEYPYRYFVSLLHKYYPFSLYDVDLLTSLVYRVRNVFNKSELRNLNIERWV